MSEKKLMRNMYIVVICSIVVLIAVAFNGTYSFFVAKVEASGDSRTTSLQAGEAAYVTITGSTRVTPITNMIPDDRFEYTFTLTNNDNFPAKNVTLVWKNVKNEFVNKKDLIYTLTNTTTGENIITEAASKPFPSNNDELITSNITLNNSATNNYKLTIIYVNDPDNNQMIDEEGNPLDMGKSFSADIEIKNSID